MTRKKGSTTLMPRKGQPGSEGNLHKRFESDRISTDIADFEKSGGRVEKLGVTWVLQKIAPPPKGDETSPTPLSSARPVGRGRP